jgi:hypothetical protein
MLPGGDAGVCYGSSDEQFKLTSGKELRVEGRWSATLVKAGGRWLVASLHESTNLYDNVLLDLARKVAWSVAMVSLVLGLIIGFIAGRKSKSSRARSE